MTRILALVLMLVGCGRGQPAVAPARMTPSAVVHVPRAAQPPAKEGELLDGHQWSVSYRTEPFVDSEGKQQPHAHLQFMADDANLYVGFYAADEDLRTKPRANDPRGAVGDRFTLKIGALTLAFDPRGGTVPPGVDFRSDVDGSIDDSSNEDEEWLVQLAIPWTQLGPNARTDGVLVRVLRTDAPRGEPEKAYAWPQQGFAQLTFR